VREDGVVGSRELLGGVMSQTAIIVLVVVGVVAVLAVAAYIWVVVGKRRRIAAMTPEEREFHEAKKQYDEAVALAEKTLKTTVEAWIQPVKTAESALADAHTIGTRSLGSYENIRLFEDHVETPQGAFRFENGSVEATVDTASNLAESKEGALSRADQPVFEELVSRSSRPEGALSQYLLIETPIFVTLVALGADDEADARQFSLSVNGAATSVAGHEASRELAVANAQADLDRVRADQEAAVASAQTELDAVRADTQRLDAARGAVEPTTADSAGSAPV